jgi:hypothetical protein
MVATRTRPGETHRIGRTIIRPEIGLILNKDARPCVPTTTHGATRNGNTGGMNHEISV